MQHILLLSTFKDFFLESNKNFNDLINPELDAMRGRRDDRAEPNDRRSRGLDVRVPDPRTWSLGVLKDGDREWYQWRKSFEF